MPIFDHWADYRARVEPTLEQGERMLAFSATHLSHGVATFRAPPGPDQRSAGQRVGEAVKDAVSGGLVPGEWGTWALFGRAGSGLPDSVGARAHQAVEKASALYLGVTDRRLLIFDDEGLPRDERPLPLLHQIPRSDIAAAEVRWARLSFGRLRVRFRDGSWLEFVSLLAMGRRRASRLRAALTGAPTG